MVGRVGRAGNQGVRKRPRNGRPEDTYSPPLAAEICRRLAEGETLTAVCQDVGIARQTVYTWVLDNHEGFADTYARARHLMALGWADDLDEIARDRRGDFVLDAEGKMVPDVEHIMRSRLRIDTRKWLLGKVLPKVFGEKVITEITGRDGGAIEMQATRIDVLALDPEQRDQLKTILLQATKGKTEDESR